MAITFDERSVGCTCGNFGKELGRIVHHALQPRGVIDLIHVAGGDKAAYLLDDALMVLGALGETPQLLTALRGGYGCSHDLARRKQRKTHQRHLTVCMHRHTRIKPLGAFVRDKTHSR